MQSKWITHSTKSNRLNLIDTPGHVDFSYEVSRSIAACEGCLLLVDSTQGVHTDHSNLYMAIEHNLEIIPVLSKMQYGSTQCPRVEDEIYHLAGLQARRHDPRFGTYVSTTFCCHENAPLQASESLGVQFLPRSLRTTRSANGSIHKDQEVLFVNTRKMLSCRRSGCAQR